MTERFSGEAEIFTPARNPADAQPGQVPPQFDTATCAVGYDRTVTSGNDAVTVGGSVGLTNGVCKDVLTDVQNTLHHALGYQNLRQSPASTGAEPFAEVRGAYERTVARVGNENLGASVGVRAEARASSILSSARIGPTLTAQAGPVDLRLSAHADVTAYDRRNLSHGAQTLNGGIEGSVGVDLQPLTGIPARAEVRAEKLARSTMPGVNESPVQMSFGLRVRF